MEFFFIKYRRYSLQLLYSLKIPTVFPHKPIILVETNSTFPDKADYHLASLSVSSNKVTAYVDSILKAVKSPHNSQNKTQPPLIPAICCFDIYSMFLLYHFINSTITHGVRCQVYFSEEQVEVWQIDTPSSCLMSWPTSPLHHRFCDASLVCNAERNAVHLQSCSLLS